jgi:alanyl-tRNA synthetase
MPRTQLLCQEDSYARAASCNILKVIPDDKKNAYVVLDKTIFHPKSGGQPSDRGKLSAAEMVFDVKRAMILTGVVVQWGKYVEGKPELGSVHSEIDWTVRYEYMRRHTAAHLYDHCLSFTLGRRVETTDSWVGEGSYIGYQGSLPTIEQLQAAETLENEMITKGAKVISQLMRREEALTITPEAPNLARLPEDLYLRVVTIEGCRGIPCGGTHIKDIREICKFHLTRFEDLGEKFRVYSDIPPCTM